MEAVDEFEKSIEHFLMIANDTNLGDPLEIRAINDLVRNA